MARAVTKKLPPFTPVFDELMHRTDMSSLAKVLYCFIVRRKQGTPWRVSTGWLGGFLGASKTQVAHAIQNLERVGLLVVHRAAPRKVSSYQVLPYRDNLAAEAPDKKNQSGYSATSLATEGPDLATEAPYREETLESKKKDLLKVPGGQEPEREDSLSQTGKEEKAVAKTNWLLEVHAVAAALFYPSEVPSTQRRRFNGLCLDLARLADTSAEIKRRHKRWQQVFPNATCTLKALVAHWDRLAEERLSFVPTPSAAEAARAKKELP